MPRKAIDYSNTIIYKLCCNNPNITDVYVGHTTDFINRKRQHKQNCNNENNKAYNFYVYQFIREHGDWTNWSMIEIEKICCIDSNEACKYERRHLELLGATLNMVIPSRTQKEQKKIYYDNNVEKEQIRHKIYYDNNVEKIKETGKIYRDNNKEKEQIRHKIYYDNNVEKVKEKHKIYNDNNKEKRKEKSKIYYDNNVEKLKETGKLYRDNNKEKEQIRNKIYYDNNVEKIKEQKKIYRDNNKEKKHELQKHIKLEREKLFDIDV